MKRIISFIILSLLITVVAFPSYADTGLTDIEKDSWYEPYVKDLEEKGIVSGFPDGSFRPYENLNADQFIKMTVMALGFNPGNGTDYWASTYINYAKQIGLLQNIEIKNYKKPLPRGKIACIMSEALDFLNEKTEIEACGLYDLYGYTPAKYVPAVLKTYNAGIITGYRDNTFRYEKYINRAEACAVIHKLVTPITRRERQITSLTPVPVCYSYIDEEFTAAVNVFEGNKGCFIMPSAISYGSGILQDGFNPNIYQNVTDTMKLLYDNITYPLFDILPLAQNNVVSIDCYADNKICNSPEYAMFNIKYYDNPTGYPERQWGYDTMFMKLELNRLAADGLLNSKTGKPDVYYEYKVKALMRLIFEIETGDVFSEFILNNYIEFSGYPAGEIPATTELLCYDGVKLVFFCEGGGRQLCFTFSKE
jgi:hypothetical protein